MKKECTKDLYERPETEEIELAIENICQNESIIDGGCEMYCEDEDEYLSRRIQRYEKGLNMGRMSSGRVGFVYCTGTHRHQYSGAKPVFRNHGRFFYQDVCR